jgi:ribA/ribD-fused uncharacterized protein
LVTCGRVTSEQRHTIDTLIESGRRLKFVFFWSHEGTSRTLGAECLSQWYPTPFTEGTYTFATAEHYMMFHKAKLFGDEEAAAKVLSAPSPAAAKAIGRTVRGFDENIWTAERFGVVVAGSRAKFRSSTELRRYLVQTGNRVLVEASPTDRVWGIGLTADDPHAQNPSRWRGLNLLGFALMQAREDL